MSDWAEWPWGPVLAIVMTGLAVVALASSADQGGWSRPTSGGQTGLGRSSASGGEETATVAQVTSGDTILITGGRAIRLIGVEAPAVAAEGKPAECFGPEALARLSELLPPGTPVRLAYDASRLDPTGQTVAYVYRAKDGLFVNLSLLQGGFVRESISPPNLARVADLAIAGVDAESGRKGLWGTCGGDGGTGTAGTTGTTSRRFGTP